MIDREVQHRGLDARKSGYVRELVAWIEIGSIDGAGRR
jgi:hypothetical protein